MRETIPGSLQLSQPLPSTCVGSTQGKGLGIPPIYLIPAADMILLSTGTEVRHLMLAADSTSQGHLLMAVLHVH